MYINEPLPFIKDFVTEIDNCLLESGSSHQLSSLQKKWLSFCIIGILLTNSVCWAKFERSFLGGYMVRALSWMFRHSKIPWEYLLQASVLHIVKKFGIEEGILSLDETDKERSKSTKKIHHLHYMKDKKSGGTIPGQCIVFAVLITPSVSIPVGFQFYCPDPEQKKWRKENARLKEKGIAKKDRPSKPEKNPDFPTKQEIGVQLLEDFKKYFSQIKVKSIVADALYGTSFFLKKASSIFDGVQVISQLKRSQNIIFKGKKMSLRKFFSQYASHQEVILIRGGKEETVTMSSARLFVDSHGKKRFVIALKYEGEEEYRDIVASDLSWRAIDIVQAYTFRWIIEVFFSDWKNYEGWGALTKHTGIDGSGRGLILSLMLDLCLLTHPDQLTCLESKLPVYTVGSMIEKVKIQSLLQFMQELLENHTEAEQKLEDISENLDSIFSLRKSKKHMSGKKIGNLKSSPSLALKYKNAS